MTPLLSTTQLSQAKRLLYMTHMAIGDYVYQRIFLKKLSECYPQLQIDLWFDDCATEIDNDWRVRRGQTLLQWFKEESFLSDVYPVVSSIEQREKLIARAAHANYDIIVFSVDMLCEKYAQIARKISATAYIVGSWVKPYQAVFKKIKALKQCDDFFMDRGALAKRSIHITTFYYQRFKKIFGLSMLPKERIPHIKVPEIWHHALTTWLHSIKQQHQATGGTVFINYLSSHHKRNWTWPQVIDLIEALNRRAKHWTYIINVSPHELLLLENTLAHTERLKNIHVVFFSAQKNFYELPALIQLSDGVISVETAIMHLASALSIPQVALVRYKASAWAPLPNEKTEIIFTRKFPVRISRITVEQVLHKVKFFPV